MTGTNLLKKISKQLECLLCVKHYSECFTYVNPFNLHSITHITSDWQSQDLNPSHLVPQSRAPDRRDSYVPVFQVRKLGPERGSHLSKVTQLKTAEHSSKACAIDLHSDPELIFETLCWESPEQAE